eukprot:TRINITY_DN12761_c2_g2_i1.p1 TRINITY_DN12761_c2_g2~~TRINITY_DN12761_c2_g2_i1.p1  ORF type:complete len:122 (-),score=1.14 TRINITY_DN12761_c2_g2_i1:550-915(-)
MRGVQLYNIIESDFFVKFVPDVPVRCLIVCQVVYYSFKSLSIKLRSIPILKQMFNTCFIRQFFSLIFQYSFVLAVLGKGITFDEQNFLLMALRSFITKIQLMVISVVIDEIFISFFKYKVR